MGNASSPRVPVLPERSASNSSRPLLLGVLGMGMAELCPEFSRSTRHTKAAIRRIPAVWFPSLESAIQ